MKKILITGANGYVGSNIENFLKNKNYDIYPFGSHGSENEKYYDMDITDKNEVLNKIKGIAPDIIIHNAGFSNLGLCEKNPDLAYRINVEGTRNIVDAIKTVNPDIKLVMISSDYVFSGYKGNYREEEETIPSTVYGKTKLEAEKCIKNELTNFIICRSANIFGRGGNFFNFILQNLEKDMNIDVFCDVFYTPTYIDYFLDCMERLLEKDHKGIIHVVGNERISRYQFAIKVAETLGKDKSRIIPVKQPEGGLIAHDSSLNSDLLNEYLGNFCPSIEKSLHYCFEDLIYPYSYFVDQRGKILGVLQDKKWEEINYIESNKGSVRGNHYHRSTVEAFFIIDGKILVSLNDLRIRNKKEFIVEKGDIFIVNPNILHTFNVLEDAKWINMLSKPMNKTKDIIK